MFWATGFWATDFWAEAFWNVTSYPDGGEGMSEDQFRRYRKIVVSNPKRR